MSEKTVEYISSNRTSLNKMDVIEVEVESHLDEGVIDDEDNLKSEPMQQISEEEEVISDMVPKENYFEKTGESY